MLQSLFHDELLKFFENQIDSIEGLDEVEIHKYKEQLKVPAESSNSVDSIREWLKLLPHKINWEKKILEWLPHKEAESLEIPSHLFPKMNRGLPRQDLQYIPSFTHLHSIKRCYLDKSLYSLYRDCEVFPSRIVVLTHVLNDGLGDFSAGYKAASLLDASLPNTEVHFVALMDEKVEVETPEDISFYRVDYQRCDEVSLEQFPSSTRELISHCDLLFEVPTYFSETPKLLEEAKLPPRFLLMGEYGSIHHHLFHPETGAKAMGLHFLEKGIFINDSPTFKTFDEILHLTNPALLNVLFSNTDPEEEEVQEYQATHRFYFAYLASKEGHFVYLHALTKLLEDDRKNIDLSVPNMVHFLELFGEMKSYTHFTKCGINKIQFQFNEKFSELVLKKGKGKTLRIIHLGNLPSSDFQILLRLSSEIAACRGDQSFSECISANKVFFYNLIEHHRTLWEDFISLAANRIPHFPTAIEYFRLFLIPLEEKSPTVLKKTAVRMGELLQNVETVRGIRLLYRIIRSEYAVNDFIVDMVKRSLLFSIEPELEEKEKQIVDAYLEGDHSFSVFWDRMLMLLSPYKSKTPSIKEHLLRLYKRLTN